MHFWQQKDQNRSPIFKTRRTSIFSGCILFLFSHSITIAAVQLDSGLNVLPKQKHAAYFLNCYKFLFAYSVKFVTVMAILLLLCIYDDIRHLDFCLLLC